MSEERLLKLLNRLDAMKELRRNYIEIVKKYADFFTYEEIEEYRKRIKDLGSVINTIEKVGLNKSIILIYPYDKIGYEIILKHLKEKAIAKTDNVIIAYDDKEVFNYVSNSQDVRVFTVIKTNQLIKNFHRYL